MNVHQNVDTSSAVAQQNRAQRWGNRVQLAIGGAVVPSDIDAVTPTMVAFRMPVERIEIRLDAISDEERRITCDF